MFHKRIPHSLVIELVRCLSYAQCSECGAKFKDEPNDSCVEAGCVESREVLRKAAELGFGLEASKCESNL